MATTDDKVLETARKRLKRCIDSSSTLHEEMLDDIRFAAGQQWPDEIKNGREQDRRPCLTVNKTAQYVRQVVNDGRQNKPAIKVYPVGDGADQDVAKVFNGLIRDIEQSSDADTAYDTALECSARCGLGYFRIISRYTADTSFVQELAIKRIRNPFSVYLDPSAEDPAGSDASFGFISEWIPKEEFEEQYGTDKAASFDELARGDNASNWMKGDEVRVVEYYSLETVSKTMLLLRSGATQYLEDMETPPAKGEIVAQRKVKVQTCIWRKLTGNAVLETNEWPSRYIPIIRVIGDEFEIDGEVTYQGIVRPAKDPQRMYNYWVTNATEKGALETKAPYIGAVGQFEGQENQWRNANHIPYAYLEYNPVSVDGTMAPPPQRNQAAFSGAVDVQMAQLSSDDMKATTGIYDAALGARSNETSGKAINARQRESDTSTFHYVDNQAKAIRHAGRILVEVIPKFYDTERIVRIVEEDDSDDMVPINQKTTEQDEEGRAVQKIINDLSVGRYDVRVSVGPSYATRRQESADSMLGFVQAVPMAGQAIMDLIAKNMDWPGAEDMAERLKKLLPPNLQESDDDDPEGAAMMQQIQALGEQLQQAEAALTSKHNEQMAEIKLKELAIQEASIKRETTLIKSQTDLEQARLEADSRREEVTQTNMAQQTNIEQSIEVLRDSIAEILAQQIMVSDKLLQHQAEVNGKLIEVMQKEPEEEPPEVKTITIKTPSGQVYSGTVNSGSVEVKTPSGQKYTGTVREE